MPTNPNMVAIQTVTVGSGGAANIEFTNIPQTYTDLKIVLSARSVSVANFDNPRFTINSSTASFSRRSLYAENGSVGSESQSDRIIGVVPAANATASTFGSLEVTIPNYTASNNKSFSSDSVTENNSTTQAMWLLAGLWSNTAAITSIAVSLQSGSNFAQYSTATLYGVTSAAVGAKATGGAIYQDADYFYHVFNTSSSFVPSTNMSVDCLIIAGGGGGGRNTPDLVGGGAGGGAGGLLYLANSSLTSGTSYTVTVGGGGAGGTVTTGTASNGSTSSFAGTSSTGGGGGANSGDSGGPAGANGGSGGGGRASGAGGGAGGSGVAGQGNAGGNGLGVSPYFAGGGGGAGTAGGTQGGGATANLPGAGSTSYSSWIAATGTGSRGAYAGGGAAGGSTQASTAMVTGGIGGGGNSGGQGQVGANGTANTGGGGGGGGAGGQAAFGGAGGSGIVIVRYAR